MSQDPENKAKEAKEVKEDKKTDEETTIRLVPMQDDKAQMEEDMQALFEEDEVTHQHGNSEPERD